MLSISFSLSLSIYLSLSLFPSFSALTLFLLFFFLFIFLSLSRSLSLCLSLSLSASFPLHPAVLRVHAIQCSFFYRYLLINWPWTLSFQPKQNALVCVILFCSDHTDRYSEDHSYRSMYICLQYEQCQNTISPGKDPRLVNCFVCSILMRL